MYSNFKDFNKKIYIYIYHNMVSGVANKLRLLSDNIMAVLITAGVVVAWSSGRIGGGLLYDG